MKKMLFTLCVSILFFTVLSSAQQEKPSALDQDENKSSMQTKHTTTSSGSQFVCPDSRAEEACKSFGELRSRGDENVFPKFYNTIIYACFRQNVDEFFVFEIFEPRYTQTHSDPQSHKQVVDSGAKAPGVGRISTFVKGIEDDSTWPVYAFAGQWTFLGDSMFKADNMNLKEISDLEHDAVSADAFQFTVNHRYRNRFDKDIDYSLVIQRSTGRFSEHFTESVGKIAFSENNGHCSRLPTASKQSRQ